MRIVMDLQGAQSESRYRGIGRYTMSLADAVVRRSRGHDIHLVLNGAFDDSIAVIREQFEESVAKENIHVWYAPLPVIGRDQANTGRRVNGEIVREAALAALRPDIVHVSSMFEGYVDNSITSIGILGHVPTLVTLYDMIPLMNPGTYLDPDPAYRDAYMEKLEHVKCADAVVAISASSAAEARDIAGFDEANVFEISTGCDQVFRPLPRSHRARREVREKFGLGQEYILYTGGSDERKNLKRLVEAYAGLDPVLRQSVQLVFAGRMHAPHEEQLTDLARDLGLPLEALLFTGYVTDEELVAIYNECLLFVFPSWHEGFGLPALEAMACGAAVIASDASSIREIATEPSALFDPLDVDSIRGRLAHFLQRRDMLPGLRTYALERARVFTWDAVADRFLDACEAVAARPDHGKHVLAGLPEAVKAFSIQPDISRIERLLLADALDRSVAPDQPVLMVDVTELAAHDLKTGIQRVTRAIIAEWGRNPPAGYRLQLVRIDRQARRYVCANSYAATFFGTADDEDTPLVCHAGDVFLGLDLVGDAVSFVPEWFEYFRNTGVMVCFVVYDILPIRHPAWWPAGGAWHHERWLRDVIRVSDRLLCISRSVADDVESWMLERGLKKTPFVGWFHLGADLDGEQKKGHLPEKAFPVLNRLGSTPSFLMVGTLEPRKGHAQVIDAFEHLWASGRDAALVIVGKRGWLVDELCQRLAGHAELGHNLFWLTGADDELLEQLYAGCTCLIAGSEGEGFGLPIIEAGQRALPVIARDIPVFREVAGNHAYFFKGNRPHALADAINHWLELYEIGQHPRIDDLPWQTWEQSAVQLRQALLSPVQHVPNAIGGFPSSGGPAPR